MYQKDHKDEALGKQSLTFGCPVWVSSCPGGLWHQDPWVSFTEVIHVETLFSENGPKPAEPITEAQSHAPAFLLFGFSCVNTITSGNYF